MIQKTIVNLRPQFIPLLIILGITGFYLVRTIITPPVSTVVVFSDVANYFATLVQHDNPALLSKDTLFRNPIYMESFWYGSTFLYMAGMKFFLNISGNHIGLAYGYFEVLALGLYLVFMYLLLAKFLTDRWLALALAVVSSMPSSLMGSSAYWGVARPGPDPGFFIPTTLAVIFITFLGWLIARRWLNHTGGWKNADIWFVAMIGAMIGIGLYAVHSISCLALIEILTVSGIVQVLQRKIPIRVLIVFVLSLAPFLVFRVVGGIGVIRAPISQVGADLAISLAQSGMVFPWYDRMGSYSILWQISATDMADYLTVFFAIYLAASLALFVLIFRDRKRTKLWKSVFITVQAMYFLLAFWMGWVAILALIYGYRRISKGAEDALDKNLLTVLVIAQIAGPLQQAAFYYIWEITKANSLISLLHEMARFELVAYLPMYILIGRAISDLTSSLSGPWIRRAAAGVLCLLVFLNLDHKSMPLTTDGLWQAILIMAAVLLATYSIWRTEFGRQGRTRISQRTTLVLAIILTLLAGGVIFLFLASQHLSSWAVLVLAGSSVAVIVFAFGQASGRRGLRLGALLAADLFCIGLVFIRYAPVMTAHGAPMQLGDALEMPLPERDVQTPKPEPTEDIDFLAMTDWVKTSTPTDSLFHIVSDETSFRYFAERSLLFGYNDFGVMAADGGVDPIKVDELKETLEEYRENNPKTITTFLLAHGVNYVVATYKKPIDLGTITYQDVRYSPLKVYENRTYVIYEFVHDPPS